MKFVRNRIVHEDSIVLEGFEKEAENLDYNKKFEEMKLSEDLSLECWDKVHVEGCNLRIKYHDVMDQWIKAFLTNIDEILDEKLYKAILVTSGKRCSINGTVYDFTQNRVDNKLIEKLNLGGNYVLHRDEIDEDSAREI